MGFEVVVVGSCNLDYVVGVNRLPLVGETVLGSDLQRLPGGKGANQAVASARLGRSVAIVGRLGDDDAGAMLRESLESDGVNTESLLITDGVPSGVAFISVQVEGDNTIVVSPGANNLLTTGDIAGAPVIAEAGVVLVQSEIPMEAIVEVSRVASGLLIWNSAPAPTDGVPPELMESVDVLVVNQSELASLVGHDGHVDAAIAERLVAALFFTSVVVTLGSEGALVVTEGKVVRVSAPLVRPVDTTAAGDAFCGALADRLVEGDDLVTAVGWANRVGAATTLMAGAQPSLPTTSQVEERLKAS